MRYNKGVNRLETFESLSLHPWLGKAFKKLGQAELELARAFLREHSALDKADFEPLVNRMFLDRPKPKHHTIIMELLVCSNSATVQH
jgi:hypothetical protein